MPYAPDHDGGFWYPSRVPSDHYDTYKRAAEQLALDFETYLYAEKTADGHANPAYMNPSFAAWAIARFDATKTSSGNIYSLDYDAHVASGQPIPAPVDRENPFNQRDDAIRYPADAVDSPHIDTTGGEV